MQREYYNISENHVLRDKDVRNFLEHFDENLEEYLNKPIAGSFYPKLVLINSYELNEVSYIFKAYVVNEFKLITLNKGVDLRPIAEEILRIHNLTIEFLSDGGHLRKKE